MNKCFLIRLCLAAVLSFSLLGCGGATSSNELATNQITLAIEVEKNYFNASGGYRNVSVIARLETGSGGFVVKLAEGEQLSLVRGGQQTTLQHWSDFSGVSDHYGTTYDETDGEDSDMSLVFMRADGSSVTIPLTVSDPAQVSSPTPYLGYQPESDPFLFSWSGGALPVNEVVLSGWCISGYRSSVSGTQHVVPAGTMTKSGSCNATAIVKQESTTASPVDSAMPYAYTFRFIRRIPVSTS